MGGTHEPHPFHSRPSTRRPQHDDLGPRMRDADDVVDEGALQERSALDLETQVGEERRGRVEVGDGDPDVVELLDV